MIELSYRKLYKSFINKTVPDDYYGSMIRRRFSDYDTFRKEINAYFDSQIYSISDPKNKNYIKIPMVNIRSKSSDNRKTGAYALCCVSFRNDNSIKISYIATVIPEDSKLPKEKFYIPNFMDNDVITHYGTNIHISDGNIKNINLGFELIWAVTISSLYIKDETEPANLYYIPWEG